MNYEELLRVEFWGLFAKRCEIAPELKGRKRNWVLHRTKINNVAIRFDTGREDALVMLEISHKNGDMLLLESNFMEIRGLIKEEIKN